MKGTPSLCAALAALALSAAGANATGLPQLVELESFLAPGHVTQMEYSADRQRLFLRGSGSVIRTLDTASRQQVSWRMANYLFTDMDISPDGRYLYAADFGGEETGAGTPYNTNYVQRYDLQTGAWEASPAPRVAYRIEAVDADRFLLLSSNQWVALTLNRWASPVSQLSIKDFGLYYGDIAYDATRGRVIHAGLGLRSAAAFQVAGDTLISAEMSSGYPTTSLAVLSSDARNFYSGTIQYDPADVNYARRIFPEAIYAASANLAFGRDGYYSADTGTRLGTLGFSTTIYAIDAAGTELWAFNTADDMLHHYAIVPEPAAAVMMGVAVLLALNASRRRGPRGC